MSRLVKTALLGALVLALGLYAFGTYNRKVQRDALAYERLQARAGFVERLSFAFSLEQDERWLRELARTLGWFGAELRAAGDRHPEALEVLRRDAKAQADGASAQWREFRDVTESFWAPLRGGSYQPLASDPVLGLRFDLLGLRRDTYEGRSQLRIDLVVWGAPRREQVERDAQGRAESVLVTSELSLTALKLAFRDAQGAELGGLEGSGPVYWVPHPERFVPDFPPQAALGVWYVDPFPVEATTLQWSLEGGLQTLPGPALPVRFETTLPVQPDWRVRPGESY